MEGMQKDLVSEKELNGAKKYLVGSFPLRLDTQTKLANFLVLAEYYGLDLDYPQKYPSLIDSVTREDVLRVARKYLKPDASILVIVGNMKEAGIDTPSLRSEETTRTEENEISSHFKCFTNFISRRAPCFTVILPVSTAISYVA